ncbi:MAG: cobalamin-independent methionine synthase II family protein [Chloroflexi bacterium]|nr:cobalamin-independent methionine synthase II family protein [Chloroflexota bacterium]
MQRSETHTLTTHAGALPRPDDLLELNAEIAAAQQTGQPVNEEAHHKRLSSAVAEAVKQQREVGIDVVNDGEYGKTMRTRSDYGAWLSYVMQRLTGWDPPPENGTHQETESAKGVGPRDFYQRRDRQAFPELYADIDREMFAGGRRPMSRQITSPITYKGVDALRTDIDNLRTALANTPGVEGFMTSVAPGSFGREQNRYYASQEDFLYAIATAMRTEYRAIVDAGFVLQIDDPGMAENWDAMDPSVTVDQYREYAQITIAALNHALEGIPEDRVRYHMCWGSWHGPHLTDIPLRDIVDVLLTVRAGAFSVEAGNVRHEHEWKVWRDVKLPPGKILIPGVVSHATNVVEHPELVADRIVLYASLVGRENVMAGTDCGLGGRIHPSLAWAKLKALAEGAELASHQLWT